MAIKDEPWAPKNEPWAPKNEPWAPKNEPWAPKNEHWAPKNEHWTPKNQPWQDTEAFDRQFNEKNVWFRPHIKYSSLKNGPDFTFAEKIQLQNALDQITKVSRIARGTCDSSKLPRRLKTSNKLINVIDVEYVKHLDTMFSKTDKLFIITDLRDPHNPVLANKSYQEMIILESNLRVFQAGSLVYVGSKFFRLGLTLEQRAMILYQSFIKLPKWIFDQRMRGIHGPIEDDPAVLLFEEIQDRLTEQCMYEEQTQAELNKAKAYVDFANDREQAEILAAERAKGYTMFAAYDQATPLSETIKPKIMKKAIKKAVHKARIV